MGADKPMSTPSYTTLALSHFTTATSLEPRSVAQPDTPHFKPRGLWVSVDGEDDWPTWCAAEEYGIGPHRFVVTLTDTADILHLATPEQIRDFGREYGGDYYDIDWTRVAEKHQGIIIAPYQWSLRLAHEVAWYYPWDAASGCIWDATAIAAVRLATEEGSER